MPEMQPEGWTLNFFSRREWLLLSIAEGNEYGESGINAGTE
jgi:hypothetical protein